MNNLTTRNQGGMQTAKQAAAKTTEKTLKSESPLLASSKGRAMSRMGTAEYVRVDLSEGGASVPNAFVQFDIDNTGGGHTAQVLRVGSVAAAAGAYSMLGLVAGASDDAVITDQGGAGCKYVQGFSLMVVAKPVLITEVRVRSSDSTQLAQQFTHNNIGFDKAVKSETINVVGTEEMYDQRTNLVIARPKAGQLGWFLDAQKYFQFTCVDNKTFSVILYIGGVHNVANMLPK